MEKMDGDKLQFCREFAMSRAFKESEVRLAILMGTLIGPVSEVHIVETLGEYSIELEFFFFEIHWIQSFVVIFRETRRFVNELHQLKREFRSSNALLKRSV